MNFRKWDKIVKHASDAQNDTEAIRYLEKKVRENPKEWLKYYAEQQKKKQHSHFVS